MQRKWMAPACLVFFLLLCYGVVDLWDWHAWNEYRRNYEAHVASLDLKAYIPKALPDDENFAATPFAKSWFHLHNNPNFLFDTDAYYKANQMMGDSTSPSRQYADLVAWQEAFAAVRSGGAKPTCGFRTNQRDLSSRAQAAPDVLEGLKDDDDALEGLRAASDRPAARYAVVYDMKNPWEILLPHLGKIKQSCLRLELKACAELALGQNEKALADVKLMLYMADSVKTEPFLISYLVRVACLNLAIATIWEGLAEHRWTDAQLQQLQAYFEPCNFLGDVEWALHAERASNVLLADILKKKGLGFLANFEGKRKGSSWDSPWLRLLGWIAPSGWYDLEKLDYCQGYDREFHGTVNESSRRVFPSQIAANDVEWTKRYKELWQMFVHHQVLAQFLLPSLTNIQIKAAAAQIAADQTAVACALERYRLANRRFPDDLQDLVPRFAAQLPNDVITGEAFKYHSTGDGRFVLYSVGWNEKDDGGQPGKTLFDATKGDWVWEYPN